MPDIFNAFGRIVRSKRFERTQIFPGHPIVEREVLSGTLRVSNFNLQQDPLTGVFKVTLHFEEDSQGAFHSQEEKVPTRVRKQLAFQFEVEGKEIPLLSGLLKKEIKVTGQIDRAVLETEFLLNTIRRLQEQAEEQSHALGQAQAFFEQRQIPAS